MINPRLWKYGSPLDDGNILNQIIHHWDSDGNNTILANIVNDSEVKFNCNYSFKEKLKAMVFGGHSEDSTQITKKEEKEKRGHNYGKIQKETEETGNPYE